MVRTSKARTGFGSPETFSGFPHSLSNGWVKIKPPGDHRCWSMLPLRFHVGYLFLTHSQMNRIMPEPLLHGLQMKPPSPCPSGGSASLRRSVLCPGPLPSASSPPQSAPSARDARAASRQRAPPWVPHTQKGKATWTDFQGLGWFQKTFWKKWMDRKGPTQYNRNWVLKNH